VKVLEVDTHINEKLFSESAVKVLLENIEKQKLRRLK
jgi:hypothetical protein